MLPYAHGNRQLTRVNNSTFYPRPHHALRNAVYDIQLNPKTTHPAYTTVCSLLYLELPSPDDFGLVEPILILKSFGPRGGRRQPDRHCRRHCLAPRRSLLLLHYLAPISGEVHASHLLEGEL